MAPFKTDTSLLLFIVLYSNAQLQTANSWNSLEVIEGNWKVWLKGLVSFEPNISYVIVVACLWISEKLKIMCHYYSRHGHQRERTSHTKEKKNKHENPTKRNSEGGIGWLFLPN